MRLTPSSADDHLGGGYNRLCLPSLPGQRWEHTERTSSGSYLFGVEYQTSGFGVSDLYGVNDYSVPCAVCEATRGEAVMIPGWCAY